MTGIFRDIEDISDAPEPSFMPSSGFVDRWGDDVAHLTGTALVNTDPRRVEEVVASLQDAVGPYFAVAPAVDQDNFAKRVRDTIDVEVTVLGVFAVAAGLTGLLVIGQALARSAGSSTTDQQTLSAIGLDRRRQVLATAATLAPAIVLGALGAVPLTVGMSSLFPRGLARVADPASGVWVDAPVVVLGAVLVLLIVAMLTLLTSWRIVRAGAPTGPRSARRFAVVDRLAASVPAVPGLGARFALERDRRRGVAGGLAGIAGAAVLVGGLVGVATIERSRDHLLAESRLFGADWDMQMSLFGIDDPPAVLEQLGNDPDVEAVGTRTSLLADDGAIAVRSDRGRSVG